MPWLVNGEVVPELLIKDELERLRKDPGWAEIKDDLERSMKLKQAAEHSAIRRFLLEQAAAKDPRPIDPALLDSEVERQKSVAGCRSAFDDTTLRRQIEAHARIQRLAQEFVAGAPKPAKGEVEQFYRANRENFQTPERFHAAHIVRHVNENQTEEQARAGAEEALAALVSGEDFSAVAERFSDCKGGGDLGWFPAGHMVPEFENELRKLEVGGRTGVFVTPFGFHVAELRGKNGSGPAEFGEVHDDITRVMKTMSEHRFFMMGIEGLVKSAVIQRVSRAQASGA